MVTAQVTIQVPVQITVNGGVTELDWAQQHIRHQVKQLINQKKWTRDPRYGRIKNPRLMGPVESIPHRDA